MKFSTAILSLAATVSASTAYGEYVTEVVSSFTTFAPEATSLVYGTETYEIPASETVTLTGAFTVEKPIHTTEVVSCATDCASSTAVATTSEAAPESSVAPASYSAPNSGVVYPTGTGIVTSTYPGSTGVPTYALPEPSTTDVPPFTAGAGKTVFSLAGVAAVAVLVL